MAVGEWDQRQLCPDGGCIGVIGPDGTCKVCGRAAPNWGDERNRGLKADEVSDEREPAWDDSSTFHGRTRADVDDDEDDEDDDEYEDDDESDEDDEDIEDDEPASAGPEWSGRELCPDGGCIGVIGPDGTCKVCGKPGTKRGGKASGGPRSGASTSPSSGASSTGTSSTSASSTGASSTGTSSTGASTIGASSGAGSTDKAADALGSAAAAAAGSSIGGVLAGDADDWGDRKLCSDPTCVGVSGLDGRCKVCGKECL